MSFDRLSRLIPAVAAPLVAGGGASHNACLQFRKHDDLLLAPLEDDRIVVFGHQDEIVAEAVIADGLRFFAVGDGSENEKAQ